MKKKKNNKLASETIAIEDEKRWRVESDLRTIQTADAIRKDKARMRDVQMLAAETMNAVKGMERKPMPSKPMPNKPMSRPMRKK